MYIDQKTVYYNMPEILKTLEKLIGRNKLEYLTTINPSKIINNENIEVETPEYIKKRTFRPLGTPLFGRKSRILFIKNKF